jgi:hypothetical protein
MVELIPMRHESGSAGKDADFAAMASATAGKRDKNLIFPTLIALDNKKY